MNLVIIGQYTDQEDAELARTEYVLRPDLPIPITTDKGTTLVAQPSDVSNEIVIRLPIAPEEVVPETPQTLPAS